MGEPLPLPIASYRLPTPQASSARLLNCYPEQAPKDARKQPTVLRRGCGIREWSDSASALPVRGVHVMDDELYAVTGTELQRVSSSGARTTLGTVAGTTRVSMADNGTDLVIVDPGTTVIRAYSGSGVSTISDAAIKVGFLDGYFVFLRAGTREVFNSGINSTSLDALDVFSAESASGDLRGLLVDSGEIVLTKDLTGEVWYDAANDTGSPFSRSPSGRINIGTAAGESLGQQDNSPFWLANDKTFRRLQSSTPEKISNYGIDAQVQRMTTISDCFAFSYALDGHLFICWTFPTQGVTLCYDCATQEWHERQSYGQNRWRVNCTVNAYGMQLAGDSLSGKIGILDPDVFEEWGETQVCEWTYQSVAAERNRLSHRRFELGMNAGDGTLSGQGANPVATLMISDDGGRTYRTKPTRSLGAIGRHTTRVKWENLGTARERVYRMQISDPVPVFVTDTRLETEGRRL